jgi:hypothetical protein
MPRQFYLPPHKKSSKLDSDVIEVDGSAIETRQFVQFRTLNDEKKYKIDFNKRPEGI